LKIKNQKDFFAGLMFMAIGIAFASGATTYHVGAAAHMGAGSCGRRTGSWYCRGRAMPAEGPDFWCVFKAKEAR